MSMYENDLPLTESMFYILLALHEPRHGYAITQAVEQMTCSRVKLGAGTLYGALKTMQKKGWIEPCGEAPGSRGKKEYRLTREGSEVFEAETERMKEALKNAERVL
ncbi:PadR family transcriptional regulator [Faecalibaculum rodentium]|uniref:PadR family transcriptional regulator n=5 Tax=Faecalibaculum rodentium TaxID=1702221 RepID=A0A1Q9YNE5_9FIRM|nr:helix-turn-helix transcriptional regulator [Faecalibaculum rodentium]OLU47327.1 PadR family transcriptional regulator [Faecalibaculum rodentium]